MIRLNIIVEGQTEETFVNKILRPHLGSVNVFASARCIETGRKRDRVFRGGLISYSKAQKDIELWMKQENGGDVRFTTMFDFYRLPADFPGYENAKRKTDPYCKIKILENELQADIASNRFIPYIQLHEFEALLYAGLDKFHYYYLEYRNEIKSLKQEVSKFINPELINENPETSPSKRIIKYLPSYDREKPSAGPIIAEHIGLQTLRAKCLHFNSWVSKLEFLDTYR